MSLEMYVKAWVQICLVLIYAKQTLTNNHIGTKRIEAHLSNDENWSGNESISLLMTFSPLYLSVTIFPEFVFHWIIIRQAAKCNVIIGPGIFLLKHFFGRLQLVTDVSNRWSEYVRVCACACKMCVCVWVWMLTICRKQASSLALKKASPFLSWHSTFLL